MTKLKDFFENLSARMERDIAIPNYLIVSTKVFVLNLMILNYMTCCSNDQIKSFF